MSQCHILLQQWLCWGSGPSPWCWSPCPPSPGKWAPDLLSLEHGPESPVQREIILLPGSGSSFPASNGAFTMGMHLFIRAGFIFMEKLLWAGVVLGESAELLSRARSCHCPSTGATKPWAGICVQSSAGFVCPVGLCILLGVFILPLQTASSLESSQACSRKQCVSAEMCSSAEAGEGQGNGFILIGILGRN